MVRFLLEAKTTRKPPPGIVTDGKRHFVLFFVESVRYQPDRSTGDRSGLWISIQSEKVPSSSANVTSLEAMNSLITGSLRPVVISNTSARSSWAGVQKERRESACTILSSAPQTPASRPRLKWVAAKTYKQPNSLATRSDNYAEVVLPHQLRVFHCMLQLDTYKK